MTGETRSCECVVKKGRQTPVSSCRCVRWSRFEPEHRRKGPKLKLGRALEMPWENLFLVRLARLALLAGLGTRRGSEQRVSTPNTDQLAMGILWGVLEPGGTKGPGPEARHAASEAPSSGRRIGRAKQPLDAVLLWMVPGQAVLKGAPPLFLAANDGGKER